MNDGYVLYEGPYDAAVVVEYIKQYGKNQLAVKITDPKKNLCQIFVGMDGDIPVKTAFEQQIETQVKLQRGEY